MELPLSVCLFLGVCLCASECHFVCECAANAKCFQRPINCVVHLRKASFVRGLANERLKMLRIPWAIDSPSFTCPNFIVVFFHPLHCFLHF